MAVEALPETETVDEAAVWDATMTREAFTVIIALWAATLAETEVAVALMNPTILTAASIVICPPNLPPPHPSITIHLCDLVDRGPFHLIAASEGTSRARTHSRLMVLINFPHRQFARLIIKGRDTQLVTQLPRPILLLPLTRATTPFAPFHLLPVPKYPRKWLKVSSLLALHL